MSTSFIGEVRAVGFNFAPYGWALCAGQLQSIPDNAALFQLIGTNYGGNGQTNFALPNLQGAVPVHQGTGGGVTYTIGQTGGSPTVTLTMSQYPTHTHGLMASGATTGGTNNPANNAVSAAQRIYSSETPLTPMNPAMVGPAPGNNLPHDNMQPYLALNWIISLYGIYPATS